MKRAVVPAHLAPVRGCPVCSLAQRMCRAHVLEAERAVAEAARRSIRRARAALNGGAR